MYIKPVAENRIQGGDQEGQHCKATADRRVSHFTAVIGYQNF